MNELIEKLLRPASPEHPCGPDLSNDPLFDELETLVKGKPEVEVGAVKKPAEPPEWNNVQQKSIEFFGRSKHLRVSVMLCCSLLKTGGLAGFRDGLQLIRGLLEQYWTSLYPLLDPGDNNDPTQRLNVLGSLNVPRGSPVFAGWLAISNHLYVAPLCQPPGAPPVTFDQVQSRAPAGGAEGKNLDTLIRAAGGQQIATQHQALQQSLEAVQGIDQFLTKTLGADNTISFDVLEKTLQEMLTALQPFLPGAGAAETAGAANESGASPEAGAISVRGSIRSREQVVQALDNICEYYRQVEPSSPVPYLLRRAQKLVTMDFVQAMQELKLATVDSLRPSMGSAVEKAEKE